MDFQKLLNTFDDLGIENKGLTVDDPMQQAQAAKQANGDDLNATDHARVVNESVSGRYIPGVSDTSANDFAALAGVSTPTQRPSPAVPNPQSYNTSTVTNSIEQRLTAIENRLESIFESVSLLAEKMTPQEKQQRMSDYDAKKKALQDIQADPHTDKDPELKKELVRRKAQLEKEQGKKTESIESSLEAEFNNFLKGL